MVYLLGLDISTTSAKALIIDEKGAVLANEGTAQPISQPKPLWSEQNPADWWDGMTAGIKSALSKAGVSGEDIAAIGLTGQMHGLVLLDADGNVLRPSILWNDQRTQAQCDDMNEKVGAARLIELTGNAALTGFTAPKILWVRDNEPEVYAKAAHVLLPKDYIRFKLSGQYAMDMAGASGTSLLNVANRTWSSEVLDALEIPQVWMPPVHEGPQVAATVDAPGAAATGLKAGTPIVGGGGDQAAGAVGMGCVQPDIIGLTVGTSGVVFAPLAEYAYEPEGRLHAFCAAAPGQWHFMGVMLSAAGSLQWYRDTLAPNEDFDKLVAEAGDIAPGAEGLQFLPYLTGERTPHPDPMARGAFVGLTTRHTRAHMTRAVLEGISFGLKDSFTLIEAVGIPVSVDVRLSGGGAKSLVWRQILADIIGYPLTTVTTTEAGAYGAALLAAVGAGVFPDVQTACRETISTGKTTAPGAQKDAYGEAYALYRDLYSMLKPAFDRMGGA